MQTFLAKCTALAVLLGGFFVTGDVTKLAEQGKKLLNATTVPEAGLAEAIPAPAQKSMPRNTWKYRPTPVEKSATTATRKTNTSKMCSAAT